MDTIAQWNAQVDATTELVDTYAKCVQLGVYLKPDLEIPIKLYCRKCHRPLGCVGNSHGVAFGDFERKDNQWSQLIGATVIRGRRMELRCAYCGCITVWRMNIKK